MVDLHTHSTASDGTFTPSELVAEAARAGIGVLALTDHDTVAGVTEAQAAGSQHGVQIVPGIDLGSMPKAMLLSALCAMRRKNGLNVIVR